LRYDKEKSGGRAQMRGHLKTAAAREGETKLNGKLFYLMGKSATGKDHIFRVLAQDRGLSLTPLVIYTTRPMREGEKNGREYYFTDEERLRELRAAGRVIEERVYQTVNGPWYYFTADDGQIDLEHRSYIGIGTLESFRKIRDYFGAEYVLPVYIETEDGIRLARALKREWKQEHPDYAEVCRRFLADTEDFSPEKIREAGVARVFPNNGELAGCIGEVRRYIRESL
jgi:guanylate kinase